MHLLVRKDNEKAERLYDEMKILSKLNKKVEITCVMGDWNANLKVSTNSW